MFFEDAFKEIMDEITVQVMESSEIESKIFAREYLDLYKIFNENMRILEFNAEYEFLDAMEDMFIHWINVKNLGNSYYRFKYYFYFFLVSESESIIRNIMKVNKHA